MLIAVKQVDEDTIERLFSIYAESMDDMRGNFASLKEMKAAYAAFLSDFIIDPKHLVLVETADGIWVSGLRAVCTGAGRWFLEAVETMPEKRKKGYGQDMLLHTIQYLQNLEMTELSCIISQNNLASQALHSKCGFVPTREAPINPWGELEDGAILFRFCK